MFAVSVFYRFYDFLCVYGVLVWAVEVVAELLACLLCSGGNYTCFACESEGAGIGDFIAEVSAKLERESFARTGGGPFAGAGRERDCYCILRVVIRWT